MISANEIWEGIGTSDRILLIDKYAWELMPYELQKPTNEQIIMILSRAKVAGKLITPFIEFDPIA